MRLAKRHLAALSRYGAPRITLRVALCLTLGAALPAMQPARAADTPESPAARVAGLWCGEGLLASYRLELAQQAQEVSGKIHRRERSWPITGHLEGARLTTEETPVGSLVLERQGEREGAVLRLVGGKGPVALAAGTRFTAAKGGDCTRADKT